MAVDFKKKIAGKATKLSKKSLDMSPVEAESPIEANYQEGNLYQIPLGAISPSPDQPRKNFDKKKLDELAKSIVSKGILQPIIIRKNDIESIDSEFLVVAGERRYRASQKAGLEKIPALFTTGDPEEIALIENLQRDDLKPIEEAEAYGKIMKSHSYTQEQLSKVVGKSRTTITEFLTLNKLPEEIKEDCRTFDISKIALLEIAKIKDDEQAISLYEKVKGGNYTVAKIKQLTRRKPKVVRNVDERILEKLQASKKLILTLNKEDMSDKAKEELWEEVKAIYALTNDLVLDHE